VCVCVVKRVVEYTHYVYMYIYTYIYVSIHACSKILIVEVLKEEPMCIQVIINSCVYIYTSIYVYMYVYIYIYIYVYILVMLYGVIRFRSCK